MPRVFIGREREREELRDTLARVIAFGDMGGPLTVVTGPRGLGKTSLLREVSANAEREGFVVAWIAGVKHQAFMTDVIDQVSRSMRRADMGAEGHRRAKLEALTVEVGIGIAKVQAKLAATHEDAAPTGALLGPVEDFLHEASTSIRERGGAGLLIVIDELHAPLEPRTSSSRAAEKAPLLDAAILLNVIQNMSGERARYPLAVLGAGLPQTKTALTQAATFGERIREIVPRYSRRPPGRSALSGSPKRSRWASTTPMATRRRCSSSARRRGRSHDRAWETSSGGLTSSRACRRSARRCGRCS
jgi:RecA/RadA recombinase